jgi:gliding motility-associated-like protein
VNGLTAGTYQFAWTITNNLCAPSQDVMQITVYPPTNPGTLAAAADVCATANSGTLLLTGFVSSVMHWEASTDNGASWSNIANTTSNYNYNNLTATTTYRALVQNAVCPALYSNNVTITVWQPVTTANAGPDQQLCNLTTATLAANTASSGTGKWTQIAGPTTVSFTNSADPNTTINGLTTGTYLFTWTISNNLCTDSKDTVQVTVYAPTVPGILAAAADVCANANSGTLLLTGFVSSVMHWEASTDNGASWSNIANTTANYNYNNLTATTTYRALVQNAVCPALYSNNVTITVWQPVTTANAGPDQQLCNLTTATLAANTASSGTGKWTQITGPTAVVFNNPADPATTVNGLTAGTYQFVWTISNNFCNDSKDTVQVTVFAPTVTGALVADAFVCVAGNDGIIKNTGATGNILRWEMSNDKDSNWVTVTNTNDSLSYHNLQKTTTYRVVVQNGNCPALTGNTVTVTVYQLSAGGNLTAHRDTVCATGNSGTLQLSNFTGTIQNWELSVDSGKNWKPISYTDTSYTYYGLNTTTWYRVLVRNGNCSDSYSDTAMVQVDQPTIAGTVTGATVLCSGNNSGMLLLSGRRGALLHWEFSTDNGNSWNLLAQTGDTLFYTGLTTTTQYRALVQNGSCAVEYTNTITLQVVPPVTPANAGEDQVICNNGNSITLNANTPVSGTGMWSMAEGPSKITFANPSQANTVVSGLITGTYYFVWTISNGICTGSSDTVVVKVDKLIASFSISSVNDCGKTTYFFNNNSQAAYGIRGYRWFNTTGDTLYKKDISLAYTTEGNHDMTLQVESNTGCYHSTQALYKVVVYEFPQANINAVADACKSQLFQVSSNINSKDSIAYILWNLGNGTKTKDSVISVKYMTDGKYTVQLTVATVNRCLDSAFKQIAIHPIPVVSINTKPVVCRGDSAILSANGAINYIWTDQDNRIICDGCITTKVKPAYNSTYKVIGYDQFGCSQLITTELRVVQPIKMLASSNDTICVGQSKQLFASGASSYIWTPETGLSNRTAASPMAKPQVTTTYQVIGRDRDNCFTDTAEIKIAVGNPTPINIGKDTVITAGSVYQLKARAERQDIRKWFWNGPGEFSCKNCQEPTVKLSNDADIYCIAVNAYGCVSNDTLSIKTFCASTDVFIPNAFSPDGDGVNDVLFVQGRGIKMVKSFRIFNRWGEVVFEKTNFLPGDPSYGWNGKIRGNPAPPDVFVYVCEVICEKGIPSIFKGNVAVLK